MPGPTTESINDDVKVVRDDLHRFQVAITADVRELSVKVGGIIWAIRILAVVALTTVAGAIWWGATLTADVRNINGRLDKLEAGIAKIVEQTRPVAK